MANYDFLKATFDSLATNNVIGDPARVSAYGYLRVSSDDQAEDGRSGLSRQLTHIHEVAKVKGYSIQWEQVYVDEYTGFEFRERPALSRLREAYRSPKRLAHAVVVEELDRLSRNADWHQGFLLHEMRECNITTVFWKEYTSRIERSVMGAVAQEGMERDKKRMMEGKLHKARSGRVTASTPAYGYKFVDENGEEGAKTRKNTYYAMKEEEATIIQMIYERIAEGETLRSLCIEFMELGIPPPKKYAVWQTTQMRLFIRSELYKGNFYARRWHHTKVQKPAKNGVGMRTVKCKVERPREEWIHVPVPPIVTDDLWAAANRMLDQNKKTSRRNAKIPYLLRGLLRCAHCGYAYVGKITKSHNGKLRKTPYRGYACCRINARSVHVMDTEKCTNGFVSCQKLEDAVWHIICNALLQPDVLIEALDGDAGSERNRRLQEQITYLEKEIDNKANEDKKLYTAYMADVFDELEYADERKRVKAETKRLRNELERVKAQVITPDQLEARKSDVLALSERINDMGIPVDPPFELKQRIIKLLIDNIIIDAREGWFRLEGAVYGAFSIVSTHKGRGYAPLSIENSQEKYMTL